MSFSKLNLLFVDDDADLLALLKESIQPHFHNVYTANSVDEALTILNENEIDLVVSDFKMPQKDGLVLRKIMSEEHPDVKFLMFTGFTGEKRLVEALSTDSFPLIEKPSDPLMLLEAIKNIL